MFKLYLHRPLEPWLPLTPDSALSQAPYQYSGSQNWAADAAPGRSAMAAFDNRRVARLGIAKRSVDDMMTT